MIHQIYVGGKPDKETLSLMKSVESVNKDQEYIFWDDARVKKTFPQFSFENYKHPSFFVDFLRIFILKQYGGWYVDTDCKCLKKLSLLNELCKDKEFITSVFDKGHVLLNNAVIYSQKKHFILDYLLKIKSAGVEYLHYYNNIILKNMDFSMQILGFYYLCGYNKLNREICVTEDTYIVHYFFNSHSGQ